LYKLRKLKEVADKWGGSTAFFFTYTHFSHDLCSGLLAALLPLIKADLALTYLQSGILLSAFSITGGLSQFPGGWLGDRISRRIVIAIGLGGVALSVMGVGLSTSYYQMLIILVIWGIFIGAYHPSANALMSGYFGVGKRGKVIALHMLGGSLGFAIGPVLGGLIADVLDWRFSFILLGIPTLAAIPFVLRKFKSNPIADSGGRSTNQPAAQTADVDWENQPRLSVGKVLRSVADVFALAVLTQLIGGIAMAFLPVYLVDKYNVAPAYAAMLLGIIRVGGMIGSLIGGWLSDRWGRINAIGLTLIATGPILLLLTKLPFNAVLLSVFALFGLMMYMRQATIQPLLMDKTPPYLRATVFGIYFGLGMEGASLAQPAAGYFMDIFGIIKVFDVVALMAAALSLAALFIVIRPNIKLRSRWQKS
jgi:FSR family fosmidomycin resistance protein-like MFS transporter